MRSDTIAELSRGRLLILVEKIKPFLFISRIVPMFLIFMAKTAEKSFFGKKHGCKIHAVDQKFRF